jgi:hypothetical protein
MHGIWFSIISRNDSCNIMAANYSCHGQNMSNLTTATVIDDVGLVTITPQQINEIKNSINITRQALEQGNISEALANLSIIEEQFSVLTEET